MSREKTRPVRLARAAVWVGVPATVSALLGLPGVGLAAPQGSYIGVSQGATHESNVFRAPDGGDRRSDTYLSTGALAGTDLQLGRQRLYADGQVRSNRYNELSQLDNVSYALTAGLDWETLNRISGSLTHSSQQRLADYAQETGLPRLTVKNTETVRQTDAVARIGGSTPLTFEAGVQHRQLDYSADEYRARELRQTAVKAGVRYRRSSILTLGAGVRVTNGRFPQYQRGADGIYVADSFRRRDVDLSAAWSPTGLSTVSARLSLGQQTSSSGAQNEFSGVTGALSWAYRPTGRLQVTTTLTRDTGAESRFYDLGTAGSAETADSRLTTAVSVAARYDATATTQLSASMSHSRRSLERSVGINDAAAQALSGHDRSTRLSVGARYAPTRSVAVDCHASKEERDASTVLSYDYSNESIGCSVQLLLHSR